jgi:hypothetical protein
MPDILNCAANLIRQMCGSTLFLQHNFRKNATLVWQTEYTVIFLNCKQKREFYEWAFNHFPGLSGTATLRKLTNIFLPAPRSQYHQLLIIFCNSLKYKDLIMSDTKKQKK